MSYISMFDFPGTSVPRGLTPPMTPEQVAEFRQHYEARYLSPQLPPQVADFRKHFDAQFPSSTSTSTAAVASAAAAAVRSELSVSSAPVAVATQPAKSEVQQPSSSVPMTTNTQTDEVSAPPTRVEAEIKEVKSEIPSPRGTAIATTSIAIDASSSSSATTVVKVESVVEVKEAAPTSPTAAPAESVSNTNTDSAKTLTAPKPFVQVDTRANVVFLGNLEAGKTTLMGHLLTATNCLDKKPPSTKSEKKRAAAVAESKEQKLVHRQRNDIEKMHGQMQDVPLCVNHFRSVIDGPSNPHCTVDFHVHLHPLRTANRVLTLIDVPGRRKYLRHLIAPLVAVDVAVLVVSVLDPMATSTSKLLTTHAVFQQLIAAYANGIRHILLVVNKIDTVKDADPKFIMNTINSIGYKVLECAKKIGFRCEIPVVPVSSFFGTNIFSKSPLMPWYTGPTLMEALDALPRPQRSTSKALRLCVLRTHQVEGQAVAFGALMSGRLHVGDTVEVLPERKQGKVLSIQHHRANVESAYVGDLVGVVIQNVTRTNMNRGSLLHRPTDLKCCRSLTTFEADIHFFSNAPDVIRPGYSPPMYNAARNIIPKLTRIEKRFQKGKEVDDLKMMKSNETALLRMEVGYRRSLPLDSFSASRRLGGLLIVDNHEIIGFGIIKFLHPFRDKCLASLMAASNNAWPKDLLHIVASYVPDDDVAKWVDSK